MTTVALLAAGRGSRLGGDVPKPLADLGGETMLGRLCRQVEEIGHTPLLVLGHKREEVRKRLPAARWVENARWATTNTAASLAIAAEAIPAGDLLWANGDVVCDARAMERVFGAAGWAAAVDRLLVGDEEVGYTLASSGGLARLDKGLPGALGESLGIHKVPAWGRAAFADGLARCGDSDYFELALEHAIAAGEPVEPVYVGDLLCLEVDFPADLERARASLAEVRSR